MHLPVSTADIVQPLRQALAPLAIYVFGSYARGEAHPGSDLDLLVVCEDPVDRREAVVAARVALAGLGCAKDVVVTSPDEIRRARHLVDSVVSEALAEGVPLYAPARDDA